ncbi:amidohydrolase [Penicillium concentricum]|uniref:Amidohydrolase n=1 Tax=Penicillium concentricum TaxID=293559 RepID=A0A9W9RT93_9EURO|nr:amidohydrolase [Penicillium concentricum]KAJ5365235.1 amidohydrolase [Penicillium concentricum]
MPDIQRGGRKSVIENVHVFDGAGFTECRFVVIDGGMIGSNPQGAEEIIDRHGRFLIPRLIDAHVHLHHEGHLQELASYGVTTALDMAMWPADKMNGLRENPGLPDIRSAGLPGTAAGSIHSCMLPLPEEALLSGPEQAESFVQRRITEGSDYIKLISDVPGPVQETLNAVSPAAHRKHKMVVAHASAIKPFNMALEANADIITHVPRDEPIATATVQRMAENKVVSVPTLTMMQATSSRPPLSAALGMMVSKPSLFMAILRAKRNGRGEQTHENARDSVMAMYRAGVPILAGTDCHDEPNSFFEVKHGMALHRELELLVEAGLAILDVLRAATILSAEHFKIFDRGIIAEGKRADLVLLREDPTKDILASRSIDRVWCAGIEFMHIA